MQTTNTDTPQQAVELLTEDTTAPTIVSHYKQIERFLNRNYSFRYNTVKGQLEHLNMQNRCYEPTDDRYENSVLRHIRSHSIRCDIGTLRAILLSDFVPDFDPFRAYFGSLPEWDEQDHIQRLAATVETTTPELWSRCLSKWLVASVGSLLDPRIVNHAVLVFSGKQGIGKTTWMERLVPDICRDYLYSGTINPDNRDTLVNLSECWLINLDELENLNKSEIGSLKELITKSGVRIRRPYGRNNENLPRRASFVGSVNSGRFLNDTTGSRRFLCFDVQSINYRHSIDVDQLYAQALHLLGQGYKYWFDGEDIAEITANNEQYQMRSVEEELLLTYFEKGEKDSADLYLNATQIVQHLQERGVHINSGNAVNRAIGSALQKHGITPVKKGQLYVYALNERNDVEVEVNKQHAEAVTKEGTQRTILQPRKSQMMVASEEWGKMGN